MIYFELEYEGHPRDKMAALKAGTKEGLEKAVEYWHKHFAPRHFRPEAYQLYGYAKRTEKHEKRKRRKFGHNNPLWFTGASRRAILRSIRITSRVSGKERVAFGAVFPPAHFWKYVVSKAGGGHRRGKELFATTKAEEKVLFAVVSQTIEKHLARADRVRRKERIA